MKVYQSKDIRNVIVSGHQGAGKTSVTEAMVFNAGGFSRLGKVDEGNSVSDYLPEEVKKKISVSTALVSLEWNDKKINLLDTPGFMDFYGEVKGSLRVADSLLMVVDAVSGAQVSTELIWEEADGRKLSRFVFINKMDRENANFDKAVESLKDKLSMEIVPVAVPIGSGEDFSGVVDIIAMKAFSYQNGKATPTEIPADLQDTIDTYREMLVEAAAEGDDELTMKYLEGEELSDAEILTGLKEGIKNAKVAPVFVGCATKNIGVDLLANAIAAYSPSPLDSEETDEAKPFAALVFKTLTDPYVGKISLLR